jgi:hypothetical protein
MVGDATPQQPPVAPMDSCSPALADVGPKIPALRHGAFKAQLALVIEHGGSIARSIAGLAQRLNRAATARPKTPEAFWWGDRQIVPFLSIALSPT